MIGVSTLAILRHARQNPEETIAARDHLRELGYDENRVNEVMLKYWNLYLALIDDVGNETRYAGYSRQRVSRSITSAKIMFPTAASDGGYLTRARLVTSREGPMRPWGDYSEIRLLPSICVMAGTTLSLTLHLE